MSIATAALIGAALGALQPIVARWTPLEIASFAAIGATLGGGLWAAMLAAA